MLHPQLQHVHADSLTTDWFNRVTDTRQWQHRLKVVQEGQIQVESFQMKPLSGKQEIQTDFTWNALEVALLFKLKCTMVLPNTNTEHGNQ